MLFTRKKWPLAILVLTALLACSKETNPPVDKPAPVDRSVKPITTLQDTSTPQAQPVETMSIEASVEQAPVEHPKVEPEKQTVTQYLVMPGDSLWSIAAKLSVYGDAHDWPLIYRSNVAQIRDPDLIKPGMILVIDHSYSDAEVKAAQKHAHERGKWELGKLEASDLAYLKQGL